MSSLSDAPSTGPRVRPITWAILAWMIIMIAAIVGAWQGSESRYGALPEITVATDRGQEKVLPFTATDLDGNTYTNPVGEFHVQDEHTLTVRLPGELRSATMDVYEVRADGVRDYTVEADGPGQLLVPVTTPEEGRIEGLAIRAVAIVYAADGSESILNGEWSVGFTYED
ncbi:MULTISPECIES: DUF2771 family protein [Dietzia]|uniref:Uncharacterized protein DUF2771 n=1 Tax=Dietzia cinnamea TaxID=321318 RepID=A0A177JJW1_9ACTN|nr:MULTISPECIES: DUF2771 family protein [Dietzia]EFV93215.1 hypothetical protein ES5_01984 [Dietzia cinnamea P4]MBS7549206.1 DUF2771 family protein [Dietzia massiliensis]OAH41094.1 hypothetical protein AYJ66_07490 [Dietzia cinnamea]TCW23728.1 uncharacterized protein DUF2771 [Dietzia cinnamea]